ncbi:leucyl aminopeptidase [Sanguibacter hominis ATCC BAA-789]|uniref:Probable cytosol aminopeptidase n=1 Tax=Sanguibacter hominis ATCC BAA-789 TaxID=1312740 RepID=A0A9X5IPJ2_9MICO|nr:leucyl aminopeptidase [Sanguibacter hominis]NKX93272.1 leucyl aminopeptidase [Sanguibacter hominis ATCC BAA-789]
MSVNLTPSPDAVRAVAVTVVAEPPPDAAAIVAFLATDGAPPTRTPFTREQVERLGFTGKASTVVNLPVAQGPDVVLVGLGSPAAVDVAAVRDAAGEAARAVRADPVVVLDVSTLPDAVRADAHDLGAALVEGVVLGRYSFDELRSSAATALVEIVLVVGAAGGDVTEDLELGAARGLVLARAGALSRDLANAPGGHLDAPALALVARQVAAESGLEIVVHDRAALVEMGCGGLLGVNAGSVSEPQMIVLRYRPVVPGEDVPHLGLVGKGITYDSGGISLKPSNAMHAAMKMDMTGAGAVLAAMSVLRELGTEVAVSAYLACTDNMPSGSATKLGDVLTTRSGRTIEVVNTDAEGRLVMSDALTLANEDGVDAIVDVATLTGACLAALGPRTAGLIGTSPDLVAQVRAAAARTDEQVWELPLERAYRPWLDSEIADIKNLGGESAGAIVAALFLAEWVEDTPWAHLDIAGPMRVDADSAWRVKGATGYGARLLAEVVSAFRPPA